MTFVWPELDQKKYTHTNELFICFESKGNRILSCASNYPYELWLDGQFIGSGGHRCVPGEAFIDTWEEAKNANNILIKVQYMSTTHNSVWHRCLFDDPFFADLDKDVSDWLCYLDDSLQTASKMTSQLPHQNIVLQSFPNDNKKEMLKLQLLNNQGAWKLTPLPIKRCLYKPIKPQLINKGKIPSRSSNAFDPLHTPDILLYIRGKPPCTLKYDTYDLGMIGLHRFDIDTSMSDENCILCYSEVPQFKYAWSSSNRKKVHLADAIQGGIKCGQPFGTRGCRYVHVIYPNKSPILKVSRYEYPFDWKNPIIADGCESIIEACRNNLIACVDGGVVDTCWRERAQWTGDARMSAMAIRTLTHNTEIIDLVLHQIAQSYDAENGMVNGAWPVKYKKFKMPMPTYHLAFCLAALENDPKLEKSKLVRKAVLSSVTFWKNNYLKGGLISGMPGWAFVDWDSTDYSVNVRNLSQCGPHTICNVWFDEVCTKLGKESGIDKDEFNKKLWTGDGYRIHTGETKPNVHSTAVSVASRLGESHFEQGMEFIKNLIATKELTHKVTPYFAYFIAKAFEKKSKLSCIKFIKSFYEPIAKKYGTIHEKCTPESSMAHGWSVGIAELIQQ